MIIDIALWLFRGKVLLTYTEKEVMKMTLRKLCILFDKYCEWNGIKVKQNVSDLLPDVR